MNVSMVKPTNYDFHQKIEKMGDLRSLAAIIQTYEKERSSELAST